MWKIKLNPKKKKTHTIAFEIAVISRSCCHCVLCKHWQIKMWILFYRFVKNNVIIWNIPKTDYNCTYHCSCNLFRNILRHNSKHCCTASHHICFFNFILFIQNLKTHRQFVFKFHVKMRIVPLYLVYIEICHI